MQSTEWNRYWSVVRIRSQELHPKVQYSVADLRGALPAHAPPMAQNFRNSMQLFGKFLQNRRLAPPPGGLAPLLRGILDPPLVLHQELKNNTNEPVITKHVTRP